MTEPEHIHEALHHLLTLVEGHHVVVGLGSTLIHALNAEVPSLRGDEPGDLLLLTHRLIQTVALGLSLAAERDLFLHHQGHDLTGYRDGAENPKGDDISPIALVQEGKPGLRGSSSLAVQTWRHDWHKLSMLKEPE